MCCASVQPQLAAMRLKVQEVGLQPGQASAMKLVSNPVHAELAAARCGCTVWVAFGRKLNASLGGELWVKAGWWVRGGAGRTTAILLVGCMGQPLIDRMCPARLTCVKPSVAMQMDSCTGW